MFLSFTNCNITAIIKWEIDTQNQIRNFMNRGSKRNQENEGKGEIPNIAYNRKVHHEVSEMLLTY